MPDWIVDEVFPRRTYGAVVLVLALLRHGKPRVIGNERHAYLAVPQEQLARLTHTGERTIRRAITELLATGYLHEHQAVRWNAPAGLSIPVERPANLAAHSGERPAKLAAHSDSVTGQTGRPYMVGVGDPDPDHEITPDWDHTNTTNAGARAREAIATLVEAAVGDAETWIPRYGLDAVEAVIARLERMAPAYDEVEIANEFEAVKLKYTGTGGRTRPATLLERCTAVGIHNPAGLMRSWLTSNRVGVSR